MENNKYNFIVSNNHILVNIDNSNYIIDTGSPFSFFYDKKIILINHKEYVSNKQLANKQEVEQLVGVTVDGFIGLDIILETGITINFLENTITFSVKRGHLCYFLKKSGYYYTSDCVINKKATNKTVIDSGACISYVSEKYLDSNQETNEHYSDFNPSIGNISGNYYKVSIDKATLGSGDYHHTIKVGKMPNALERMGIDAIISLLDIVKDENYLAPEKTVSIDLTNKELYIL